MPDPITPDTVRALIADTEPRPPLTAETRFVAHGGRCSECGVMGLGQHRTACLIGTERARLHGADNALRAAAPAIALAYLDAIAERDRLREIAADSPPPADAGLLALANRTLAADLETVRAERDRLARVIADPGDVAVTVPSLAVPSHVRHYTTLTIRVPSATIRDHLRARLEADCAGGSDV